MARRLSRIVMIVLLALAATSGGQSARAQRVYDAQCADPANVATFQSASGATQVTVCPSLVLPGHPFRVTVHARRFTPVRLQVQLPDRTIAASGTHLTDGLGQVAFDFTIHYNPINRFVQVPLLVLVGKGGRVDMASGAITIEQGVPLSNSRLRVRPASDAGLAWCPVDPALCVVHNNSQIIIRVDTDPAAQVNVLLLYPDNQSVPCTGNDLTSSTFADDAGVYRCELPVVFQTKGKQGLAILRVVAQISSGSYSRPLIQKLYLAPS